MMSVNPALKILVLGDSHVYWLGAFGDAVGSRACLRDFTVGVQPCAVKFMGLRGGSVTSIRSPEVMSRVCAYQPDVVILSLGGNDLDKRYANTEAVTANLQLLMMELLAIGAQRVAVCQLVRRRKWHNFSYDVGCARVQQVNEWVAEFCKRTEGVFYWRHKRIWNSTRDMFRSDGVHMSDIGNYRLFRSIRGVIIKAVGQVSLRG